MTTHTIIEILKAKYPKVLRRIKVIAAKEKMTISEAIIFCLKGETTQCAESGLTRKNRYFSCSKGETTCMKGGAK